MIEKKSRRKFVISALAAVAAVNGTAEQAELEFYYDGEDADPPGLKLNLFDAGIKTLNNDLGNAGRREGKDLKLSVENLKSELLKATQSGSPSAIFWPKKVKLESWQKASLRTRLAPFMEKGDPGHAKVYYTSLVETLKENGLDSLADAVTTIVAAESESPLAFFVVLGRVGAGWAKEAFKQMGVYWCGEPVYSSLNSRKEDPIVVHAIEVDIVKSKTVMVAGGTKWGTWLSESLYFQCHDPEVQDLDHDLRYYPLWQCNYTADTPISKLLPS